jgi:hypothetical protein
VRSLEAENKKRRSWLRPGLRAGGEGRGRGTRKGTKVATSPQSNGPIWVVDIKFSVGRLSETRTEL